MPFRFDPLSIPDVLRITPARQGDHRGFFSETCRGSAFEEVGIRETFHQDNHGRPTRGMLRGLHYQAPPRPQAKLVRVVQGDIFDVAVDLRVGSLMLGQWAGGVAWDDPVMGIPWPLENPTLSERDLALPRLDAMISPFQYGQ
jgi:dTDP-4-dehydrorhamnose 3,5-epimerase